MSNLSNGNLERKHCTGCDKRKSLDEFPTKSVSPDGRGAQCKECVAAYSREYYAANSEKIKARTGEYQKRNRERTSAMKYRRRLLTQFGITPDEYEAMLERQGRMCGNPGCENTVDDFNHRFHVDHDHSCCPSTPTCGDCTRAILCPPCNKSLGLLGEDTRRIAGLLDYIKGAWSQ